MPNPERSDPKEPKVAATVTLSEKDAQEAARLLRLLADSRIFGSALPENSPAVADTETVVTDRQSLIERARIVLGARRIRMQFFHPGFFGEPAWEILLALYITEESEARFTASKLAEWIGAPLSTVLRWVKALEEQSLVDRIDHPTDRRICFIRLLDKGRKALDSYLGAIPG